MNPTSLRLTHCADDLIVLFNSTFRQTENTVLQGQGVEPFYQASADAAEPHRIIFTQDYFASALHEIAHWCVAGPQRRLLDDYGYWYAPDGRSQAQQLAFEQVEVVPQALEWLFATACGFRFRVSADNLQAGLGGSDHFRQNILTQSLHYCSQGLTGRSHLWLDALSGFYGVVDPLNPDHYTIEQLG